MGERKPGIDPSCLPIWKDHELEAAMKRSFEQAAYFEEKAAFWRADAAAIMYQIQKRKASRP